MRIAAEHGVGPLHRPMIRLTDWLNPASYRPYFKIPILCFAAYVGLVTLPSAFVTLTDFDLNNIGNVRGFEIYQIVAVFLIFTALIPAFFKQAALVFRERLSIVIFLASVALYGTWYGFYDDSETSLSQASQLYLTLICFYCMMCFWKMPPQLVTNTLMASAAATAFCLAVALIYNGIPENRWVGGLHPNFFARSAWVAMGLYMAAKRRFSFPALLACLAASVLVGTRTTIVVALIFTVFCSGAISLNRRKATYLLAAFIVLTLASVFASMSLLGSYAFNFVYYALDLDTADRGFSSGLSGRDIIWSEFFRLFDTFYLTGAGFRSERYKDLVVHSGTLSYFCDFGMFIGSAIYGSILSLIAYKVYFSYRLADKRGIILASFSVGNIFYQFLEPDNFQIGVWGSVVFMLALAYPVSVSAPHIKSAALERTFRRTARPPQRETGPPSIVLPMVSAQAGQAALKQRALS